MRISTKYIFICLFSLLFVCSCGRSEHEGYTYNKKYGYYYKLFTFSDTYATAHPGDVVSVRLTFSRVDDEDTVFFLKKMDVVAREDTSLNLPLLLLNVHTGDSLSFIVSKNRISNTDFIPLEFVRDTTDEMQFSVFVSSVMDSVSYAEKVKEESLWRKAKHDYEVFLIQQYMKRTKQRFVQMRSGIYKRIIKSGKGDVPGLGDNVSISYQGSLLNGKLINDFTSMDFQYGSEYQVIKGIELALKTMKKGERAKIIIPSEYAWGEDGSSDGSIPPYTPVVFDLEYKK